MEHAGARVTRIRTRMFIYIHSLSSTIPSSHEGGERRMGRLKSLEGRHACLVSDDAERGHGEGNERRGIPFTPSPGNVFSCVTCVAWRIFHPDRGRVITTAPGNSFWSKERILGARDACGEREKEPGNR